MAADVPDYLPADAVEDGPASQIPDLTKPLYVRHDVPGCVDQDGFNAFVALLAANQQDAAENVRGCTWLPAGARAVLVDTSGFFDPMVKVAVPTGSETLIVWTSPKCLQNMTTKARRMIRQEAAEEQREEASLETAQKSQDAANAAAQLAAQEHERQEQAALQAQAQQRAIQEIGDWEAAMSECITTMDAGRTAPHVGLSYFLEHHKPVDLRRFTFRTCMARTQPLDVPMPTDLPPVMQASLNLCMQNGTPVDICKSP